MRKLFVLTNHTVTAKQRANAVESLNVDTLVDLPPTLKQEWGTVPPELDSVCGYAAPFLDWLAANVADGDVVWVQGEWGITVSVLDWCRARGVRCVYATTKREATEVHSAAGVQMTHVFVHVRFRDYPVP